GVVWPYLEGPAEACDRSFLFSKQCLNQREKVQRIKDIRAGSNDLLAQSLGLNELPTFECRNGSVERAGQCRFVIVHFMDLAACSGNHLTATPLIIATHCRRSIRLKESTAGMVNKPSRLTGSIPAIATLLIAGLGVAAPISAARAKDCLAAPNSPAPEGR